MSLRRRTDRGGITAYLGSTSCWPLWQVSLRVRQWRRCMTGPQIRDLHNALSSAYDLHTLEEMLRCCLDKSLEQVAGSGSLRKVLYNLITTAIREGWLPKLIEAAKSDNPGNPRLQRFCEQYRIAEGDELLTATARAGSPVEGAPAAPAGEHDVWQPSSEKAKRVVSADEPALSAWRPAVGLGILRREGWLLDRKLGEGSFGEVWLARN